MVAEAPSRVGVDDRPRPPTQVEFDELPVVDLAQEADPLAVRALARRQVEIAGQAAHLALGQVAHREEQAGELGLREMGEEVGLVLDRVGAAQQAAAAAGAPIDAGVVAGGDPAGGVPQMVEEGAELDAPVAEDVRTRGAAAAQLGEDLLDDALVVLRLQRHDPQGHAGGLAGGADVAQVLLPGAVAGEGVDLVLEPDLQIEGGDLVLPRLLEQAQGDGAVDAAREEEGDPHGAAAGPAPRSWCRPGGGLRFGPRGEQGGREDRPSGWGSMTREYTSEERI